MKFTHLSLSVLCAALLANGACQTSGDAGGASRLPDPDVGGGSPAQPDCPLCEATGGGDTGDFGGGVPDPCLERYRRLPISAALAAEFELDQLDTLPRRAELSFGWAALASEFDAPLPGDATLQIGIELGEAEYLDDFDDSQCESYVELPLTLHVETSDGSLRADLHGKWTLRGESSGGLARVQLADARSVPDLTRAGEAPKAGYLEVRVTPRGAGLSGSVSFYVRYDEGRFTPRTWVDPARSAGIQGFFPIDRCAPQIAIEDGASQSSLADASALDVFEQVKEMMASIGPADTRYEGLGSDACAAPAEATLRLQTLIADTACLTPYSYANLRFDADATIAFGEAEEDLAPQLVVVSVTFEAGQIRVVGVRSEQPAGIWYYFGPEGTATYEGECP